MPPPVGFGKHLAHTEKKVRDQAVVSLMEWLNQHHDKISDMDLLKLWKGLFYCFWMSDKPLVQQHLAEKLASVPLNLEGDLSLRFIKMFWATIIAEWHGIDRLRLDKFYLLLRKFHFFAFQYLHKHEWSSELVDTYLSILSGGPFSISNSKVPDGLRYHTVEVYLEELSKSVGSEIPAPALTRIAKPLIKTLCESKNRILLEKVVESLETLIASTQTDDEMDDGDSEKWTINVNLKQLGAELFKAAAITTASNNRNLVYRLFERVSKLVEIDVSGLLETATPAETEKTQVKGTARETVKAIEEEDMSKPKKSGKPPQATKVVKAKLSETTNVVTSKSTESPLKRGADELEEEELKEDMAKEGLAHEISAKKTKKKKKVSHPKDEPLSKPQTQTLVVSKLAEDETKGKPEKPAKRSVVIALNNNRVKKFLKTTAIGNVQLPSGSPAKSALKKRAK